MALGRPPNCLGKLLLLAGLLLAMGLTQETALQPRRLLLQLLNNKRITISNEKLPVVEKYCSGTAVMPVSEEEAATARHRHAQLGSFFKHDNTLLRSIIHHHEGKRVLSGSLGQGAVLYFLPVGVGLVASVLLFCCLLLCVCQQRFRPSLCEGLRGEMDSVNWLAIAAIVLLAVVCLLSALAAFYSYKLRNDIGASQCALSQLLNTMAYGGVTQDHANYFVGIRTARGMLKASTNTVQRMAANMSRDIDASRTRIEGLAERARKSMEHVADKSGANETFSLTYYIPVPRVQQIASRFGGLLGSPSHPFSLLGGMYLLLKTADLGTAVMGRIQRLIDSRRPQLRDRLGVVNGLLQKESAALERALGEFNRAMLLADTFGARGSLLATGFYVLVCLSCIGCICAVILYHLQLNSEWKCCLMAFFVLVGILCFLAFVVCVTAAVSLSAMSIGCKPFLTGLDSPASFRSLVLEAGFNAKQATLTSQCFGDGNAQFLSDAQKRRIVLRLNMANQLLKISDLLTTSKTGFLSFAATKLQTHINDYYAGRKLDIAYFPQVVQWFEGLAAHTEMAKVCSLNIRYHHDRLLPGITSKEVNCPSNEVVNCSNFGSCPSGCIDLTATMLHYNSSKAWVRDIKARYGQNDCGVVMAAVLGALYNNWHRPRIDSETGIGGVKKRFEEGPLASIALIDKTIADFQQQVHADVGKLKDLSKRATDSEYGVLTVGTNCRVIGEKAIFARDSVCYRTFNGAYRLALVAGAVSFALLVAMILLACAMIRHEQTEILEEFADKEPCCCAPEGQPVRESYQDSFPIRVSVAPPPFEIERIQSHLRYSSPSTAFTSRIGETGFQMRRPQRSTYLN